VQYQYDDSGLRTDRATSFGNRIAYTHDTNGQVASIAINDQVPVRLERNAAGRITSEHLGEQLRRTYGYDEEGRLVHQRMASALTQIERSYQYDLVGNLIAKHDSRAGNWRYTHDPLGRIIESTDPLHQVRHYTYDPAGDLLKHLPETQKGLRSATHDGATYRFDPAGNLVERTVGAKNLSPLPPQATRFEWDENNRLRTAHAPGGKTVHMAYDAIGRRVRKIVNGERTFFAWDGDALLAEKHEDQGAREYVYYPGTFEPLALIDTDGRLYYYHNDLNGLPRELTRPNGTIVWSATYDPLGRVEEIQTDDIPQPLRMQGQYWDDEIGLSYNRYRYFDPRICSFISQDPIGFAGGENVYAYAPNVWGWVDPLGLCPKDVSTKGKAIIRQFENGYPEGHFTIEIDDGVKRLHTEQLITKKDRSATSIFETPIENNPVHTKVIDIPDATSAIGYQKSLIGKELGTYDAYKNSCLSHVVDVLESGGAKPVNKTDLVP
jgi:RHS repeat-associated protein